MKNALSVGPALSLLALLTTACPNPPPPDECMAEGMTDEEIQACLCETEPETCEEPEPDPAFTIQSPEVQIDAGSEIVYCYYFRTPNTAEFAIKSFSSTLPAGVASMNVYFTPSDIAAPGTMTAANCGLGANGSATNIPAWAYGSTVPESSLAFPADDGAGKPVGMTLPAAKSGYIRIHFVNPSELPIRPQVELTVTGYKPGTEVTQAASFVTYNGSISIPPNSTGVTATNTCAVPAGAKFFSMTMHTHKQGVRATIRDGVVTVYESYFWDNPVRATFAAPFHSFASGGLTYECEYDNPTTRTIQDGNSVATDEACMALTYFFPATQPVFCYNNIAF